MTKLTKPMKDALREVANLRLCGGANVLTMPGGSPPDTRDPSTAMVMRLVRAGLVYEAGYNRFYCTERGYDAIAESCDSCEQRDITVSAREDRNGAKLCAACASHHPY